MSSWSFGKGFPQHFFHPYGPAKVPLPFCKHGHQELKSLRETSNKN